MQDPQIWGVRNTNWAFLHELAEETTSTFDDEWICAGTST
jgi:hypothetical protein